MKSPELENKAVCITNDLRLGALISSYFNEPNKYFSIFRFPEVNVFHADEHNFEEDGYMLRIIGREAGVLINNAIARLRPDYIILAGLDEMQKSFLKSFRWKNVIDIGLKDDLEEKLKFLGKKFEGEVKCNEDNILDCLIEAKRTNRRLIFDENAEVRSVTHSDNKKGVVVIENKNDISSVIAVNYAFAINAEIFLVEEFNKERVYDIQRNIYKWREDGDYEAYKKVEEEINKRVKGINFSKFEYATFFTEGLPYSLILKNSIPMSYVNRSLREDLFIFNNIFYEGSDSFDSAIVFSPEEFGDEETQILITKLKSEKFFVKELIGNNATVDNFDKYVGHYPYDILHICSHGGETDGYYVIEEFEDRKGKKHQVEYEEIVGFSRLPGKNLVREHRKAIFRKFDGFKWISPELKRQDIPSYVFEDMRKTLFTEEMGKNAVRRKASHPIFTSCHVKCFDSIHQGEFLVLASQNSPIIFNNTCSSWYEISKNFIAGGCRGYIGTLWKIKNSIAKDAANKFYGNFLERNVLDSFFEMCKQIKTTLDSDIYIYWGLPFSTIKKPKKLGRGKVLGELLRTFFSWVRHIGLTKSREDKRNSIEILRFIKREVKTYFGKKDLQNLEKQLIEKYSELSKEATSDREKEFLERGSIDLPI